MEYKLLYTMPEEAGGSVWSLYYFTLCQKKPDIYFFILFERMKESLNEVMADKVPKIQKKQHKKWMTEEILNLMEDGRKAKSNIDLYKTLNTQIKDKCNKEQWTNEQCKEIENNLTVDSKYMHSKIKDIKGTKGCTAFNCIKAKDGNLLMEREDVLNRWSEYIEDMFQDDRGEKPIIKRDMDGPPILKEEVSATIRKMKHGKAVGPDNIPIEVFAVQEDIGIVFLTKLLNTIYDSGKIPKVLAKSVFITLPKIPGTMDCELYRTNYKLNESFNQSAPENYNGKNAQKSKTRDITTAIWFRP